MRDGSASRCPCWTLVLPLMVISVALATCAPSTGQPSKEAQHETTTDELRPGHVRGAISVDGEAIELGHGEATVTTMGGEDPVTFVLLTEKPVPQDAEGTMAAMQGRVGAYFWIHLRASGTFLEDQVQLGHPAFDLRFPRTLPNEGVRVTNPRIGDGEIRATVASPGELRLDGHTLTFRLEVRLPVGS